jgi:siroheme synthase-like protein
MYPIFLRLEGQSAVVIGAGKIALRKTRGLVEAGARVTVVAPEALPEFAALPVVMRRRRFRLSDLDGARLVFAATNDREVNRRIGQEARRGGAWVNVADAPEECSFYVPARVRRRGLELAVSTGGRVPRLAAALRRRLETLLEGGTGNA